MVAVMHCRCSEQPTCPPVVLCIGINVSSPALCLFQFKSFLQGFCYTRLEATGSTGLEGGEGDRGMARPTRAEGYPNNI